MGSISVWITESVSNKLRFYLFCLLLLFQLFNTEPFIDKCGLERKIYSFNELNNNNNHDDDNGTLVRGIISNIEENIRHCEWLITFDSSISNFHFINLYFNHSYQFNCKTDTVYIFDGGSYEDPLLASINGPFTKLMPIFSKTNSLLILHYTEYTNQTGPIFSIEFSITDCPLNCSGNGICVNNSCICDKYHTGFVCQFQLCPNNCSNLGNCVPSPINDTCLMETEYFCNCKSNIVGQFCNINLNETKFDSIFNLERLFSNEQIFSARASHASVYDPVSDSIYIYGGRNYELIHSDLLLYSIQTNKWYNLTNCDMMITMQYERPKSLWAHTLNIIDDTLILFGGISDTGIISNELWFYNLTENRWQRKFILGIRIPGLAFHISIIVEQKWLYIHGGYLQDSTISPDIYRLNIRERRLKWELLKPINTKAYYRQIAGHTAIFYPQLRSIVIFGGISFKGQLRNEIHLYQVDKNFWTIIPVSSDNNLKYIPNKRAFHSMTLIDDYLLIFGGFIEQENIQKECTDNRIYLYSLNCHQWIDLERYQFNSSIDGLITHNVIHRRNHLFVIGGYFNNNYNGVSIITLPPISTILANTFKCPGICSLLTKCISCLVYGRILMNI